MPHYDPQIFRQYQFVEEMHLLREMMSKLWIKPRCGFGLEYEAMLLHRENARSKSFRTEVLAYRALIAGAKRLTLIPRR